MSNEINEYNNLNPQYLYLEFEVKYNDKYKFTSKKYWDDFKAWFKSYYKSELFVFFIIILISTSLCSFIYKGNNLYKIIYVFWMPTFLICSIIDYYLDFKIEEKIIANKSVDEIFLKERIEINKDNLDKLIKSSQDVGSRESRIFMELRKSNLYLNIKSLIIGFLGIILGYFSSIITKGNIDNFMENIGYVFIIFILTILYLLCFYILYYSIIKTRNRTVDLYIQILKDKKLTLDLRK
ncbi:hypothetical protein [Peptoniphilus sp. HMSC062D09]|uniref:hypothetical protein n=1 Tax=Peptoniphilus sp. HMSC062D09 TaxID=1739305 RepID=UPI0008A169DB|nr:hypothetical protein [Peptoniphilus sp. HMSC062D09]OFK81130.1 hypothetical protein HMPREF2801_05985 [Peptoniphilus sp. HMSC062D09]